MRRAVRSAWTKCFQSREVSFASARQIGSACAAYSTRVEGIGSRIAFSNTQLRLIPPPSGDEATIAGWLGLWDGVAQNWTQGASAYRLGEYRRLRHLIRVNGRLAKQAETLVSGFPFHFC
jgi:hypothetical protein